MAGRPPVSRPSQALLLVAAWAAELVALAVAWIRSPFTGPGPMFLGWTALALPLVIGTWSWLDRIGDRHVPRGRRLLAVLAVGWTVALWAALSGVGAVWRLDGMILRDGLKEVAGTAIQWLPGIFGLVLGVAGLAAALEARYRVSRE